MTFSWDNDSMGISPSLNALTVFYFFSLFCLLSGKTNVVVGVINVVIRQSFETIVICGHLVKGSFIFLKEKMKVATPSSTNGTTIIKTLQHGNDVAGALGNCQGEAVTPSGN